MFSKNLVFQNALKAAKADIAGGRSISDSFKNLVEDEIDEMVTNLKATPYSSYLISDGIEDSSRIFCDPLLQTSTGPVGFPAPAMQSLRNVDAQVPIRSLPYPSNVH